METTTSNSYSDEIEIDLGEILMLVWHYMWLIILSAVLAGAIGFAISKFAVTPLYESSTRVYILDKKDNNANLTYSDLQLASQLTKDYAEMIKSRKVLEQVIENKKLNESYSSLLERVKVASAAADSRILAITVTDPAPLWAQSIADEIRNVASQHITDVMDIEAVNIVDTANLPVAPSSPNVMKWTAIAFILGAFVCVAVLIIRFMLDDTVKTTEDVEKFLNLSTLAMIPLMDEQEGQKEKIRQERLQHGMGAEAGDMGADGDEEMEVETIEAGPAEAGTAQTNAGVSPEAGSQGGFHMENGHKKKRR